MFEARVKYKSGKQLSDAELARIFYSLDEQDQKNIRNTMGQVMLAQDELMGYFDVKYQESLN